MQKNPSKPPSRVAAMAALLLMGVASLVARAAHAQDAPPPQPPPAEGPPAVEAPALPPADAVPGSPPGSPDQVQDSPAPDASEDPEAGDTGQGEDVIISPEETLPADPPGAEPVPANPEWNAPESVATPDPVVAPEVRVLESETQVEPESVTAPVNVAEADAETDSEEEESERIHRFAFGSYGRLVAASDLNGSLGSNSNIIAFGPRVDEDVYAELEFRREDQLPGGMFSRVVATLAIAGPLFHLDGDFDEALAIRNLFAQIDNALVDGLSLWAGSRMVRGDDIYLLNYWPLDNLNIVGGGAEFKVPGVFEARLHVGMNRPRDPFFYQTRDVVAPSGFVPDTINFLDRPRIVTALRGTYYPLGVEDELGLKVMAYGELHSLPEGQRGTDNGLVETLPGDSGFLLGAQVGLWLNKPEGDRTTRSFVNAFFRFAKGLAAYDTFDAPFRLGTVRNTNFSSELTIALSANFEWEMLGVQLGAYFRSFSDTDPNGFGAGDFNEGTISVRPHVWIGDNAGLSADISYQAIARSVLDEQTGEPVRGSVTKLAFIPFYSFFGRGTYTRPHLRLIYSASIRDEGAQALYSSDDPRSARSVEHFLGVGAEWWFDSTSYQ